jgi:hypothetical protein
MVYEALGATAQRVEQGSDQERGSDHGQLRLPSGTSQTVFCEVPDADLGPGRSRSPGPFCISNSR